MFQVAAEYYFGKQKGNLLWTRVSMIAVVVIVILLIVPIVKQFL